MRIFSFAFMNFLMFSALVAYADGRIGDWIVQEGYDKVSDEFKPHILSFAKEKNSQYSHTSPFMGINCNDLYFGDLDIINSGVFNFRTNNMKKPTKMKGDGYQGNDGLRRRFAQSAWNGEEKFWSKYQSHFANMIADREMYVSFDSYSRSNQTITVSLRGFTKAIEWLDLNCELKRLIK